MKITVIRGDNANLQTTITNADDDPINLTNATVFFTVKVAQSDDDDDAVISKDITSHTNPTQGITTITLNTTDTDISPGLYYYDLQVKTSSGLIESVESDIFEITQDTTLRVS